MSEELVELEIDKIFFEYFNLELCKSGVEIIDFFGLNKYLNCIVII